MRKLFLCLVLTLQIVVNAQNPLFIPPTLTGPNFNLNLQLGLHQFFPGPLTNTSGVNGNILGPTLIFEKDSFVNIYVTNNILDTTTMHWHGLHVSPENDGGPHTAIAPGTTWNPSFTVLDKAATYWYHPHLHHKTNKHVTMGVSGMLIVKDSEEAALNLPRDYGVDDFPLILQTKAFDAVNQIDVMSHEDSTFMINATLDPYLDAPAQTVRLRLLNGSSMRTYYMGLSDTSTFYQIASDGGLLSAPVSLTRLRLGPGERVEILLDLNGRQGQTIDLVNYCEELPIGIYGAEFPAMNQWSTMPGYGNNPLNLTNYNMLQINVVAPTASPVTSIPGSLAVVTPLLEANADNYRTLNFGTEFPGTNFLNMPFLINGNYFNMDSINEYILLNDIEVWTINNNTQTAHPFHIHDVQFYILDRDGTPPPLNEQGRKDVVTVFPFETVRFIAQFATHESDTVPYMYHCHMLPHEDHGMMGQFIVSSDSTLSINDNNLALSDLKIYPNPVNDYLNIESKDEISTVSIYNLSGELISVNKAPNKLLNVASLSSGFYILKVISEQGIRQLKFIKN